MTWKSILVHVRAHQEAQPAIEAAASLARRFDARLTGLFTNREVAMLKLVMGQASPAIRDAEERAQPVGQFSEIQFRNICAKAGVEGRFELAEGNASELLCLAGRVHDLLVIEQSAAGLDDLGVDSAEECVIASGVPTLLVPRSSTVQAIGKTVVVAWNNSRQAAVATHGALPLIQKADDVVVLLGEERDAMPSVTRRPNADVASWLGMHARQVRVAQYADGGDGASLQAAAIAAGGDVLVMGAYGRSAWREFLFGGTTRDVMTNMRLPVLMAS